MESTVISAGRDCFMELDESKVKDILRNREEKLRLLDERKKLLEKEADRLDPATRLASPGMDGMPGSGNSRDLADRIIRASGKRNAELAEISQEIGYIMVQEDSIDRVWRCFLALPDPYYAIIQKLYVQGNLYAAVEMESGVSHGAFEKKRKAGMKLLLTFYQSDFSTNELIRQGRGGAEETHFPVRVRHGKKKAPVADGQITLAELDREIRNGG